MGEEECRHGPCSCALRVRKNNELPDSPVYVRTAFACPACHPVATACRVCDRSGKKKENKTWRREISRCIHEAYVARWPISPAFFKYCHCTSVRKSSVMRARTHTHKVMIYQMNTGEENMVGKEQGDARTVRAAHHQAQPMSVRKAADLKISTPTVKNEKVPLVIACMLLVLVASGFSSCQSLVC